MTENNFELDIATNAEEISKKLGIFSFFTGAGFLDLGFEKAGYDILFANEIESDFCKVFRHSRKKMGLTIPPYGLKEQSIDDFLNNPKDIEFLTNKIVDAHNGYDLIGFIGGPPCPDFSVGGKNRGVKGDHGKLSQTYLDIICKYKPDFFVFENVKGLWRTAVHRAFFDKLCLQAKKAKYSISTRLINALEYGVPQDRERIILIGISNTVLKDNPIVKAKSGTIPSFPWHHAIVHDMDVVKNMPWPGEENCASPLGWTTFMKRLV